MAFKEKLYQALPHFLQDAALAIESRRIAKRRYSADFHKTLRQISHRDKWSPDELNAYQIDMLRKNLVNACENTSFYRSLFDQAGFNPFHLHDPDELKKLPVQDKATIKNNPQSIINPMYAGKQFIAHTSGTTGSGLIFPESYAAEHHQWATWWRYRINLGIPFNSWCSLFGGRTIVPVQNKKPPFWKILPGLNQISYSMYHLNPANVAHYVKDLNQRKTGWVHGYPSTLSHLASLMKEQNLQLNFPVKFITTGAENLLDHQRQLIAEIFGTEPCQHYGLAEPVANISECEFGKLHIDEDYSFVELLPVGGVPRKFHVVGTSFTNEVLFFLRYDTKDIVTLSEDQTCACRRNGRIIASIDGRQEDFLTLKNGTKVGRLDHILKDQVNIMEAQIRQEKTGRIAFYIVKSRDYTSTDEADLLKDIKSRLDSGDFEIIYTDKIEKTANGKLRFVVSELEI
jgi:phenylacetate-CoA ligase